MPSIEIICIGQTTPLDVRRYPFAVEAEPQLLSHRGESSLFQRDFDRVQGCIYHLGNPYLKDPEAPGAYFASQLLKEWWERLEFEAKYIPPAKRLFAHLLAASPEDRLLVTSDYQFGPRPRWYRKARALDQFWSLHATRELHMNALYTITFGRYPVE